MKTNSHTSTSRGGKWASVVLAFAMSCLAWTTSAKDQVPTNATSSSHVISSTVNPDGSQDNILGEVGVSTHLGKYTGLLQIHVDAGQYDPGTHALLFHFTGTGTSTAANGDTSDYTAEGVEIVPLDASFAPLPPPYAFSSTWEIVGGTGRFAGATGHGTAEGLDYGDGTNSRIDTGVISTVGSNKK